MSLPGIGTKDPGVSIDDYMQQQAKERFDKVLANLRAMPSSLMLVIRNLNTVRAIAREHGDPVNRYRTMARLAVSGKYKKTDKRFWEKIAAKSSSVWFETRLWQVNSHRLLRSTELVANVFDLLSGPRASDCGSSASI